MHEQYYSVAIDSTCLGMYLRLKNHQKRVLLIASASKISLIEINHQLSNFLINSIKISIYRLGV